MPGDLGAHGVMHSVTQDIDFRSRALREAKRYGDDDLVFLRELAQNSRDAGANRIAVTTRGDDDGGEWVVFEDDGSGMTFEHARAFLFRLYASSKESNVEAAGKFGVGFWSVLRWEPDTILVESRTRHEGWAVVLDAQLNDVQSTPCTLDRLGTRVAIRRSSRAATPQALSAEISGGVRRYCRYLRKTGRGFKPLPITCDGKAANEPFHLPGPFSIAFKNRDVEGVVGLADEPRVELYARGLLVTTASVIEEIEPGASVMPEHRRVGGLAPVILINADFLDVVLSRQAPVRGRALRRVIKVARTQLHRLVEQLVDGACPIPWWQRVLDGAEAMLQKIHSPATRFAALSAVLGVAVVAAAMVLFEDTNRQTVVEPVQGLAWSGVRAPSGRSGMPSLVVPSAPPPVESRAPARRSLAVAPMPAPPTELAYANLSGYAGATVDVPDAGVVPWGLTYEGTRKDVLFRALTLDRYDPEVGWLRTDPTVAIEYPEYRCRRGCLTVRLQVVAPDEPLVVPLPTGMWLERHSLRFAGAKVEEIWENEFGEAVVKLEPGKSGVLSYRAGKARAGRQPPVDAPVVDIPEWVARKLLRFERIRQKRRRVERVTDFVSDAIDYDVSPEAARAFANEPGDWLERVLNLRAGDCDVKNGVNVLLLRRLGVPARMAVGIAARAGRARPNLHAWTEYYSNGWRAIDATGVSRLARSPVVAAAVPAGPSPPPTAEPAQKREETASAHPSVSPASMPPATTTTTTIAQHRWSPPATAAPMSISVAALMTRTGSGMVVRWPVVAAILTLLILFGVWWATDSRMRHWTVGDSGSGEQQKVLARVLQDALAHPDAWRSAATLWRRRILPTLRGRPMSVADALRRAVDGVLFVTWKRSDLALAAAAQRTPVLDGGDSIFGGVVAALGRTVDLDALSALRPPAAGGEDITTFRIEAVLEPVNRILRQTAGVECRICPALGEEPIRDIDLRALSLPRGAPWPKRFIAVNPRHADVRRRARLLAVDPARGVFVWLDWLLDRSQMLARDATRVRERAASELLEVVA
ncbi:MAG: transglutaminase domain-containing protein [Myxococcota bacterium]